MWQLNTDGKWNFNFDKVGRWWNNTTEIDIVAFDSAGKDIIFGECKHIEVPTGADIFYSLENKSKEVEWKLNNRNEQFILFSINGFTDEMKKLAASRNDIFLCE